MLGVSVERPGFVETTALGAAMLAAAGAGLYPDLASAAETMRGTLTTFSPNMADDIRQERLSRWSKALDAA